MVRYLALALVVLVGCDSGPPPPRPTTLSVTPSEIDFDALGAAQSFTAVVFDQNGDTLPGALLTWSSSNPAVFSVDAMGVGLAVGNGTAVVRAESDDAAGQANVTVEQMVDDFRKDRGDSQQGQVGRALLEPIQVLVRDPRGGPIVGRSVDFSVAAGGGSVEPATAVTNSEGKAFAVWTVGPVAGEPQQAQAELRNSSFSAVGFTASTFPGPASELRELSGGDQVGLIGTGLPVPLRIAVLDEFDNPRVATVTFSVVSGGGTLSRTSVTTGSLGVATTNWTLGPDPGEQRVRATAGDLTRDFVATAAATAGPPAQIESVLAEVPQGLAGFILAEQVSVVVRDAQGIGVEGVGVTFTPSEGLVSPTTTTTNQSGVAATAWLLSTRIGPQTLEVTTAGVAPFFLTADALDPGRVCPLGTPDPTGFDITLCFTSPVSADIEAAFIEAKNRWEELIVGDLSDVPGRPTVAQDPFCLGTSDAPLVQGLALDDVLILASVVEIDGQFNILGSASPCYIRESNALSTVGFMRFDVADLDRLAANGQLADVVLHEMAHVLGIGTLWEIRGLLQDKAVPDQLPPGPDTHYSGAFGIAAFDEAGGADRTDGQKVPVENIGRGGSINGHWREATMDRELMTPFLDSGDNPLSIITVQSLVDLGYEVSNAAADPYTVTNVNGVPAAKGLQDGIALIEEALTIRLRIVDDETGQVIRTVSIGGN